MERNPNTGLPVCPADEAVRGTQGADTRGWFAERHRHAHLDGYQERPRVVKGAAAVIAAVVAALWLASCGGEVTAKVDPTADPKVQITWEREVRALCDVPAKDRIEWMNRVNNEWLNEAFVVVGCPGFDMLNTDAKPLLVEGSPALGVNVQVIYLLPGMGEQANGGARQDARAVGSIPPRPHHHQLRPLHSLQLGESLRGVGATNTP